MMLSSWVMKPTWYKRAACPMKKSVIAIPIAIRTMCCFRKSGLEEEFHLHAGELDHVVILERVRRRADHLPVHVGAVGALHMRDEVALRPPGEHGDLHAGLAQGG